MLRARSSGVAQHSNHIIGKAIDFEIPGVPLEKIREMGLRLQRGGVGFYPTSGSPFVHLDTGSIRHWPRMTHDQLAKLFPDGRTVHVPSDGKPLPAMRWRWPTSKRAARNPMARSLAAARNAGIMTTASIENSAESNATSKPKRSLLAAIVGGNQTEELTTPNQANAKPSRLQPLGSGQPEQRSSKPQCRFRLPADHGAQFGAMPAGRAPN